MQFHHSLLRLALLLCAGGASIALAQDALPSAPQRALATRLELLLGEPLQAGQLDDLRGGFDLVKNDMQLGSTVSGNSAVNVLSGNNAIADGAFTNASGLPMVIQNSGSNVAIQNATIVNVQLK